MKRMNDDGFSIIEAMVAVVILSIIFIPIVNSFISSIKASNETKIMQEATSTAQVVMEEFKKKSFKELSSTYTVTEGDMSTDAWTKLKMEKDIARADNGCCDFNVQVEVSKNSTVGNTSGMNAINSVSMPVIYTIDSAASYTIKLEQTPDYMIENLHKETGASESTIRANIKRNIQVNLEKDAATGNTHLYGKVGYQYGSFTQEDNEFDTTLSTELKNLYLFYVADYTGQVDSLSFANNDQIEGNLYVMGTGATPAVQNFQLEQQACTNLDKFHIATTVKILGIGRTYDPSVDADFVPDASVKTRRFEIKVTILKKSNGKEYSSMTSTRGE